MNVVKESPKYKHMVVARRDVMKLLGKIVTAYNKDDDDFLLVDVGDIKGCLISTEIMGDEDG